ncbi:2,3-diketo-5-methylthio-1-phosphopentane phosphatase [Trichocladium antarcticum]|uniref:Enolase-phosphatase E1 n=1 Tax=Trichocladium antarcticum TaxID=1450529 RepID=A0AAN6UQY6_9PEZI|nr:2,3-diketo-5-methylthio-1-phosphopentane phosphatase [Trichocladium antarcticum]
MAATTPRPRVVLLDIEGTVCPISFVKDVLFPYALTALPTTLATSWTSPALAPYLAAFPPEHAASPAALTAHVQDLMRRDVKAPYLKALQGRLWAAGYASGALRAPLFPDVAPAIAAWTAREDGTPAAAAAPTQVVIYSSGSVAAQKLLFRHTNGEPADLTPVLSGFFDTVNAGPKQDKASYERIMADYDGGKVPAGEWLFLSDNVKEVEAAKEAGMQSVVVDRPGNAELEAGVRERHRVVTSFDELL